MLYLVYLTNPKNSWDFSVVAMRIAGDTTKIAAVGGAHKICCA
jgi:hypothetical protein